MKLRVTALALTLAAGAVLACGTAAFADDDDDRRPLPGASELPRPHHQHPEENELHERYGEDVGQVNLPPLAVKDGNKTVQPNSQVNPPSSLVDAGEANPAANLPVDPKAITPHQATPADSFFQTASVGLGVMGAGAVALGAVAIRRSAKLRKDPKADFLYE